MILAIDPGTFESAYCFISYKPMDFGKVKNDDMLDIIACKNYDAIVIEKIASYGMPVGAEVFDTCIWIGRFMQTAFNRGILANFVTRSEVRQNLCHSAKANDATVKQALVDRFAYGVRNHGKGTKQEPGYFYGFSADVWAAFSVGVTFLDRMGI